MSYLGNPLVRDIDYTINYNNGRMDITPLSFTNVDANLVGEFLTGITKANPGVVSVSAHPFNTGDLVYMNNVGGMTQLNNRTFQITRINNNAFSIGIDTTAYSTWVDNGLLNLAIIARRSISRTNPVRIYKTAHGFLDNAQISISATSGMEQLNNRFFTVTNSTANYFDLLGIDGSAYTPYLANGSILEYRDIAQYTFLCEFDIPVRFDTDKFSASFDAYRDSDGESLFTISSLPVIEIRV